MQDVKPVESGQDEDGGGIYKDSEVVVEREREGGRRTKVWTWWVLAGEGGRRGARTHHNRTGRPRCPGPMNRARGRVRNVWPGVGLERRGAPWSAQQQQHGAVMDRHGLEAVQGTGTGTGTGIGTCHDSWAGLGRVVSCSV